MNSKICQKIKRTFFQLKLLRQLCPLYIHLGLTFFVAYSIPLSSNLSKLYAEPSLVVSGTAPALRPSEELLEEASELYAQRCANCHGMRGDGRGIMASKLNPPPRNLRSYSWFKTTTPKYLKRVILGGGSAIGKSLLMPANPDLRNKPKLVSALIYYLEQLVDRPKNAK